MQRHAIHYFFHSRPDRHYTIEFEAAAAVASAAGLSVGDVRRAVRERKRLLPRDRIHIYSAQTGIEYEDEAAVIPKNTWLMVKRAPGGQEGEPLVVRVEGRV
jgi:hypothetical protein